MKINLLKENKMRQLFTDHREGYWYYCRIYKGISFNLTITKRTGKFEIDILDEDYLQPYDYQHLLDCNPNHKFAKEIDDFVQSEILKLVEFGIVKDYELGECI